MKRLAQDTTCVVDDPDRDLPHLSSAFTMPSQDSSTSVVVIFFAGMPSSKNELEITHQHCRFAVILSKTHRFSFLSRHPHTVL